MKSERPSLFEMIQALGRRLKTNPRARLSDRVPKADNPLRRIGREMAALEAQNRKAFAFKKKDALGNGINPVRQEKKREQKAQHTASGRAWRRWKKAAERADRAKAAS